ncbi:MAG TPA: FAD-dependent oxidoreductase [Thermoanaerobaculia bacterium]|nr:FAD-dependent oxidoreductase [Thermoanaerobaculia bacterium]
MPTDFAAGIALSEIPDGGMIAGTSNGEAVLVSRRGDEVFAVAGTCTHYAGPLAEGIVVGDTVRCPWHHACFDLRTGDALRAPAMRPLDVWKVEREGDKVFVREKSGATHVPARRGDGASVVIIGAGAAGIFAAQTLRQEGHSGRIILISRENSLPYDKPNLSKDYLAGHAPEEWIPLQPAEWYEEQRIELRLGADVESIDTGAKSIALRGGEQLSYVKLVLATGASPRRLDIPGANSPHVHYLRTFDDSKGLIEAAKPGAHVVVIGAGFIGLEVAASMRARELDVTVVGPEQRPLEMVLGREVGDFIRSLHESKGVRFRLGRKPASIESNAVVLDDGERLPADFVVIGVGVVPSTELAERAGIAVDRGILVDDHLRTNARDVYAAGDVARWPYGKSSERIRIEHWVVAARQGQTVAHNILGRDERFAAAPFFWSAHYDVVISYVGYARPEQVEVQGSLENRDATVLYKQNGRLAAVATIFRDRESLEAELAMERELSRHEHEAHDT